jgi:cyanate lyase
MNIILNVGFRTTEEKKKDPTGDRGVITLEGKVSGLNVL